MRPEPGSPTFCPNGSPWGEDRHYSDQNTYKWRGHEVVAATCKQCGDPIVPDPALRGWTRYLIVEEEF